MKYPNDIYLCKNRAIILYAFTEGANNILRAYLTMLSIKVKVSLKIRHPSICNYMLLNNL